MFNAEPYRAHDAEALLLAFYARRDYAAFEAFSAIVEPWLISYFVDARVPPAAVSFLVARTIADVQRTRVRTRYDPRRKRFDSWLLRFARNRLDAWLIRLARERHSGEALAQIEAYWRGELVKWFIRRGTEKVRAHEMADEVLLRALYKKSSASFDPETGLFSRWIERIRDNYWADERGRNEVATQPTDPQEFGQPASVIGVRRDEAWRRPVEDALLRRAYISTLAGFRTLVRKAMGYRSREIATADGVTEDFVDRQTKRERDRLKKRDEESARRSQ